MTRRNLVTNPSFRDGTTNYSAINGATLSITTEYSFYGSDALQVTKSGDNNSGVITTIPIPVVAGLPYAASAYVRLPKTLPASENANLALTVSWRNSLNVVVPPDGSSSVYTLDDDTSWARLSGVWTAPVGATVAFIQIAQVLGGTSGKKFILDALLFEQSNYVGGYANNLGQGEENRIVNKALSAATPMIFNGMELNADVILNELVFNTIDEDGVIWVCTGISGWWGQSTPESPDIPRGTEDGSYDVSGRYQARALTLTGSFFPPNREALGAARDRLVTASNLVRRGGWLRTNENPTRAAYVRLNGQPQIETVNARGRTDFSIGLRAGDPIKYEWNDADPGGYTTFSLGADDSVGSLINIGTADVTGTVTMTGPLGAGSRIFNSLTNETMTLVKPLRGRGLVGTVSAVSVTNNISTVKTTENHHLMVGDEIIVSGVGLPYDTISGVATVLASSTIFPYSFSYSITSDDQTEHASVGRVQLADDDTLSIDTYNRVVSLNGSSLGHRNYLETLTSWLKFAPGINIIEFYDDIDPLVVVSKQVVAGVATLVAEHIHYLIPGETVSVALNEEAALSKKSLTSNVVTLTTAAPHGFSLGDEVDIESTELSVVDQKSASGTVATLRTVDSHGVSASDVIVVALPTSATPNQKSLTSNVATLTTVQPHGFSIGDSVTVTLMDSAVVVAKALTANQATLTTSGAHNFQIGDSITVTMPTVATVVQKDRVGSLAYITTSADHGFSQGDVVAMALPASATLSNSRSMAGGAGGYLATLNTSAAHNFSVGDVFTADIGITNTQSVSNRSATTTECTLTIGTHGFSVGEQITVSAVDSRYNGTFYISSKTSTTVTYAYSGATESSTGSSGSVLNVTISAGYNGTKVITSIPTSTSFTFYVWAQDVATSSTVSGTSATLVNDTNVAFNGTKTLSSASGSVFQYAY